jgi:probable rRNA maturation factor
MTSDASTRIPGGPLGRIPVLNRQRQFRINRKAVALFCAEVLRSLKLPYPALSVVFVRSREMCLINRQYRGKDYATDVLSFSYDGVRIEDTPFIGEILISPEVAARQAVRYGMVPENEIRKLLVHGILHLLGYDHETDKGQMNRIQAKLVRRKFFLHAPLLVQSKVRR